MCCCKCCSCCNRCYLTFLVCITFGIACLASLSLLITFESFDSAQKRFVVVNPHAVFWPLLAIFLLSLYASLCGKSCARSILGTVFIVFAVLTGVVAVAISILTSIGRPETYVEKIWNSDFEGIEKFHELIQENLNCCGLTNSSGCPEDVDICMPKLKWGLELSAQIVGGLSLLLMVLFICGAVAAFKNPQKKVNSCENSDQTDTAISPEKHQEPVPDAAPITYEIAPSPYYPEYSETKKLEVDIPIIYKNA